MAKIILSDPFVESLSLVWSDKVLNSIKTTLQAIESFPDIGSHKLPASICTTYGNHVRKMVVHPFDIVHEYDEEADLVRVLGLVHGRQTH